MNGFCVLSLLFLQLITSRCFSFIRYIAHLFPHLSLIPFSFLLGIVCVFPAITPPPPHLFTTVSHEAAEEIDIYSKRRAASLELLPFIYVYV